MFYWVLIGGGLIVGTLVSVLESKGNHWHSWVDHTFRGIFGAFIGAIAGLAVSFLLMLLVSAIFPTERFVKETWELQPITVEGDTSYYLGAGYDDGSAKYAYAVNEDFNFSLEIMNASVTQLHQSDDEKPRIEVNWQRFKNDTLEYWLPSTSASYYDVYIPKDAIKTPFNVDVD
jgi:hypothetical protein